MNNKLDSGVDTHESDAGQMIDRNSSVIVHEANVLCLIYRYRTNSSESVVFCSILSSYQLVCLPLTLSRTN